MKAKLVLSEKDGGFVGLKLTRFPVSLGREPDNDIALIHDSVSRKHAEICAGERGLAIKDLGSANGTFVNGRRVSSCGLSDRDVVQLGKYRFRVDVESIESPEAESVTAEWDLSTRVISPEELEAEMKAEREAGALGPSTGAVLGFFQEAGRILESAFDLDDILRGILDLTFRIIPAERGFVLLSDPESGEMRVRARKSRDEEVGEIRSAARLSQTILDYAAERHKAVLTTDATSDERFDGAESVVKQSIRGAICVPLTGRAEILGAVYVDSRLASHKFSINDFKLLTALGAEMGIAVENARLYEAKIRAERLAAVGQAVASLSHCVKNVLNGMEGGSFVLQKGLDNADETSTRKGWSILKRSSARLKDLMLDMLAYSKPREPVYEDSDGNSVPEEVTELLKERASAKGVDLEFSPDRSLPTVALDARAIYRAVLNLVANAIEACPDEGGKVEVRTLLLPGGEQFQILVRDNGCGISEEDLSKLGRVFFSTKGSQGTGLGLPVIYKVIAEHRGSVSVSSRPGDGTTFTITLPVREPSPR